MFIRAVDRFGCSLTRERHYLINFHEHISLKIGQFERRFILCRFLLKYLDDKQIFDTLIPSSINTTVSVV